MNFLNLQNLPYEPRLAATFIVELLLHEVYPIVKIIHKKLQANTVQEFHEDVYYKIQEVYTLCCNQIKKSTANLFDVFKVENSQNLYLQESRKCNLQRLSWCVDKLTTIEQKLDKYSTNPHLNELTEDSFVVTTMYFINWIDESIELLTKLGDVVYKVGNKETEFEDKYELVECLSGLHVSLEELLTSAMTLYRYFSPEDEHIVKTRCEVVLREAMSLQKEMIRGDNGILKASMDSLVLPIMPSNVNVLSLVLKMAIYALERSTNSALLRLIIDSFSCGVSPVELLQDHFMSGDHMRLCHGDSNDDCVFVKEFDLYNEKLLQIGLFAISCSSDQKRLLTIRSGLATLEALEPHLVPTLTMSPVSQHAELMIKTWKQEVQDIRDSVFLIVDPAAFIEASVEILLGLINKLRKDLVNKYNNKDVCEFIHKSCVVYDFLSTYELCEPDALSEHGKLEPLLKHLDKIIKECKVVSNLLCSDRDYSFNLEGLHCRANKRPSTDALLKRLIVLYSKLKEINSVFTPNAEDSMIFNDCSPEKSNATYTCDRGALKSAKPDDITRTSFARSSNLNVTATVANRVPLIKLLHRLKMKKDNDLRFDDNFLANNKNKANKTSDDCEKSIFYNNVSSRRNRSLMKLSENLACGVTSPVREPTDCPDEGNGLNFGEGTFMDDATSLQITRFLDQMSDMTKLLPSVNRQSVKSIFLSSNRHNSTRDDPENAICNTTVDLPRRLLPKDESEVSAAPSDSSLDVSRPSSVPTLERLTDLNFVQSKLNSLKLSRYETSL